jgi:germination protein M
MKCWKLMLLCAALVLNLCGCASSQTGSDGEDSYDLYFCWKDLSAVQGGDALGSETVEIEGSGEMETEALAGELMRRLLDGPETDELASPFPSGLQFLGCTLSGTRAVVDVSASYATLSGVELTLADYCITLTLTQISDISSVEITVLGESLTYRDQQVFTADDVLLTSSEDVVASVEAMLYFLDEDGALAAEPREVDLYEGDTQVKAVVQALQAGPRDRDLRTALPEELKIQSVWTEEAVCYVNLSAAGEESLPQGQEMELALTALSRSLCSLESVEEVRYLVGGEEAETYCGVLLRSVESADAPEA